jgi:pyruvate kinase
VSLPRPSPRPRRTKIVATLGPATDGPGVVEALLRAGANVVRCNFSHGQADDHRARVAAVRDAAARLGVDVGVIGDLQGPKLRIGRFAQGPVQLAPGDRLVIDAALGEAPGPPGEVGTNYADLPRHVAHGDHLMLSDGLIELEVRHVAGTRVECAVIIGGLLRDAQGLNRRGGGLSAPALTDKDRRDIALATELDMDWLAVSFVREAGDLERTRALVAQAGGHARLIAKIERAEAVTALPDVLAASDAVMVARGDLGVEIGDAELPGVQKRIIRLAREMNRPCITATQMMESMTHNPMPTRAEVLDVANAVMDGTDAVMLSAETATGAYPVKAVEAMARVCTGAERYPVPGRSRALMETHFTRTPEAIAMAAAYAARHAHADAVVALTESGNSALLMSRMLHRVRIYALTSHARSRRRMALYRGVVPVPFERAEGDYATVVPAALALLRDAGLLRAGERVVLTQGERVESGATNTLKLLEVAAADT